LLLPTLIGAALVYGGFFALIGRHETFPLGGLLALIGGVPMVALIALYVQRPRCSETASDSIPIRPRGYDAHEVDALLLGIAALDVTRFAG
jgi:hypothetical protein